MDKKKKPILRAEDEIELLKTMNLSVEMILDHERHRVQLVSLMQLAGITGNLCYRYTFSARDSWKNDER